MIKYDVFWFYITMNDVILMEVAETFHNASNYEFYCKSMNTGILLVKRITSINVVSEITTIKIVNQQIEIFPILKGGNHIDNMGMVYFAENVLLVNDRFDTLFCYDFRLIHHF